MLATSDAGFARWTDQLATAAMASRRPLNDPQHAVFREGGEIDREQCASDVDRRRAVGARVSDLCVNANFRADSSRQYIAGNSAALGGAGMSWPQHRIGARAANFSSELFRKST